MLPWKFSIQAMKLSLLITSSIRRKVSNAIMILQPGALLQWLKLPAWKAGDHGFEPHSGLQVSKKQNVSSPLIRKDSILWGTYVAERWRARPKTAWARISNPVPGGQCHLVHLTIFKIFLCMCTKVA